MRAMSGTLLFKEQNRQTDQQTSHLMSTTLAYLNITCIADWDDLPDVRKPVMGMCTPTCSI